MIEMIMILKNDFEPINENELRSEIEFAQHNVGQSEKVVRFFLNINYFIN